MRGLTRACETRLQQGERALDVVETAVAELESSGLYVAGKGSAPNTAGYVELDASIMDGARRAAGAVAAVAGVASPVRAARQVLHATPHVMLAGNGARAFAMAQGLELIDDPDSYYVLPVGVLDHEIHEQTHGTVGAVALDQDGNLAAATSTGGTFGKLEGRVGDSPLIGSGTWADDQAAVSFTGTGEYIILAGGAISVAHRIAAGEPPETAIAAVLAEIERLGGDAGAIVVTSQGDIAMVYNSQGMKRASVSRDSAIFVATFEGCE
jgi:isoaspartyl peptidase/L-asparaginase-like protein (Ntn-hydrolase superfamily)